MILYCPVDLCSHIPLKRESSLRTFLSLIQKEKNDQFSQVIILKILICSYRMLLSFIIINLFVSYVCSFIHILSQKNSVIFSAYPIFILIAKWEKTAAHLHFLKLPRGFGKTPVYITESYSPSRQTCIKMVIPTAFVYTNP